MDWSLSLFNPNPYIEYNIDDFVIDNKNNLESLPPEPQLGNIEYKLKIVNPTKQRFEHLVTQLKWRLHEGNGVAIYQIGVEDCGILAGLSHWDMTASLQTLQLMALRLGANTAILHERVLENGRRIVQVRVEKAPV
ncbi:GTP-binding protein 2-like [Tribolium madens]|uniref:GTP-binding protein 2-like n=1 Tax=Tribolium madens TaxID=41895 RepID=UPI001CF74038|nr:GTP-binding protein 2-like [Tribolium madens]